MALTDLDRQLLGRCLNHVPAAWTEFVDRFLGLICHVVQHTAYCRSVPLTHEDVEDLCAEVLLRIVAKDYAVLRRFRGKASLATYLTVVARRICVRALVKRNFAAQLGHTAGHLHGAAQAVASSATPDERMESEEEVRLLLGDLAGSEAAVVRMYHLEGKSYREIRDLLNIPENTIGPTLYRAQRKMRRRAEQRSTVTPGPAN